MNYESQESQEDFLRRGGIFAPAIRKLRKDGALPETYVFREFPKALNLPIGPREISCSTEDIKGRTLTWTENREATATMVVENYAQEHAVLEAFEQSRSLGLEVEPDWTAERLLNAVELKTRADAKKNAVRPDPIKIKADRVAALKAELALLQPETAAEVDVPENALTERAHNASMRRKLAAPLPVVAPDPAG